MKFIPQILVNPCSVENAQRKEYVELTLCRNSFSGSNDAFWINENNIMTELSRLDKAEKRKAYTENISAICIDKFPKAYHEAILNTGYTPFFSIKGYKLGNNDQFPLFDDITTKRGYKFEVTSVELVAPYIEPSICSFSNTESRGEFLDSVEGYMHSFTENAPEDGGIRFFRTMMMVNLNGDTHENMNGKYFYLDDASKLKYAEKILFVCEDKLPLDIRLKKQSKVRISGYKRGVGDAAKLHHSDKRNQGYKFEITKIEILE
jgi:hypothetical protein